MRRQSAGWLEITKNPKLILKTREIASQLYLCLASWEHSFSEWPLMSAHENWLFSLILHRTLCTGVSSIRDINVDVCTLQCPIVHLVVMKPFHVCVPTLLLTGFRALLEEIEFVNYLSGTLINLLCYFALSLALSTPVESRRSVLSRNKFQWENNTFRLLVLCSVFWSILGIPFNVKQNF